jgi:hypothetical protein
MTVVPQDAPRSEDGQWWWDGSTWQPVANADGNPTVVTSSASTSQDADTYLGYLDIRNLGWGRFRVTVSDISDPDKLARLMFPAGRPPSVEITWQVEGEGGGAKVDIFEVAHVSVDAMRAMAQPFEREIEQAMLYAPEDTAPTPEETAARQERDRQEQNAFRAAVMPHLDPVGSVTGAMIVDDYTRWAGVRSTQDGWIVWIGKFPGGIEVSGFPATDLNDDERAQVVKNLQYYFDQGMTAERAQLQMEVDFQNDLRLVLTQVALAFIAV